MFVPGIRTDIHPAHVRALVVNVPDPVSVIAEMARLLKLGGYVLLCRSPTPERVHLLSAYAGVGPAGGAVPGRVRACGADLSVGRRLPAARAASSMLASRFVPTFTGWR
jgi:ubiquinone/menaquinone biosynthesis C-methylase UbiE